MTAKQQKELLKAQQGELDAVLMYQKLAAKMKDESIKSVMLQLAADEGRHAAVFHSLTQKTLQPKSLQANAIALLRYLVGWKALFKLMAGGEYRAEKKYIAVVKDFPEVKTVQDDEHRHGDILLSLRK